MDKARLWSKDFIFAILSRLFSAMVFLMLTATVATYTFAVYQASVAKAGIAVGMFILAAVVSRIFAGRYTELIGRKRLLVGGSCAFFLTSLGYFLPVDFSGFLVIRFLHGFAFGVANNTLTVAVTSYIPDERWGEGLGFFALSSAIASAVGPFIGIMIVQQFNFTAMFVVSAICALAAFLPACFMSVDCVPLTKEQRHEITHGFKLSDFFEMKALPLSLLVLITNLCYGSVNSFVNTFASGLGLGRAVSWFFMLNAFVVLFSRPLFGKLLDRRGDNAVMYPSLISLTLAFFALGLTHNVAFLMLSAVLFAVGYSCVFSSVQAIVARSAPTYRMGIATSTFYVFADIGLGLGPVFLGVAVPFVGYDGMYFGAAVTTVGTIVMYFFIHGRTAKRILNGKNQQTAKRSAPQFIITIAREHGSGGREIGISLADEIGIPFYGRDEVKSVALEMGVDNEFSKQMDDQTKSKALYNLFLGSSESAQARETQDAVLKEIASRGPCVVLGRAADSTFCDVGHRVSIFIHAPMEYKIGRIMKNYGETRREAIENIERTDRARRLYYHYVTGSVFGDPHNYDLTFDASIGVEKSVRLIRDYLRNVGNADLSGNVLMRNN